MKFSDSTKNLIAALVKAQAQFESAKKSSSNPFFKSKYADLSEIIDAVKKGLSENGLCFVQTVESLDGSHCLKTILFHESGESISSDYPIFAKANDAQGFGAGVTYARRYSLQTLLGIPADDDDGNVASGNGKPATATPPAQSQKPAEKTQNITGIDFFKNIPNVKVEENEGGDVFVSGQGAYTYRTSLVKLGFVFSSETKSWIKKAQVAA